MLNLQSRKPAKFRIWSSEFVKPCVELKTKIENYQVPHLQRRWKYDRYALTKATWQISRKESCKIHIALPCHRGLLLNMHIVAAPQITTCIINHHKIKFIKFKHLVK